MANLKKTFQDNAEIGSGSLAVLLAGVANHFGIPLSPEMVAAGAGLLVGVGQRFKEWRD